MPKKPTLRHMPRLRGERPIKYNPDCEDCRRERQERRLARARKPKGKKPLTVNATVAEYEWVKHAASLRGLSAAEYVKRAINMSLIREGVDAVLFLERGTR